MLIYCIINASPDSYINAAVIERSIQNYAACVLKISKKSIYACGLQGFVDTYTQIANKRYYDKKKEYYKRYYVENKEKIKSAKIACRLINKKEEEKQYCY